jgi:hypothetical protein
VDEIIPAFRNQDTPSAGVKTPATIEKNQANIYNGRPAVNYGPPPSLFNPALAKLTDALRKPEIAPSPDMLRLAHEFIVFQSDFFRDEKERTKDLKERMPAIFDIYGSTCAWEDKETGAAARMDATWSTKVHDAPFMVLEVKNETGLDGDAMLQSTLGYTKILCRDQVRHSLYFTVCVNFVCRTNAC